MITKEILQAWRKADNAISLHIKKEETFKSTGTLRFTRKVKDPTYGLSEQEYKVNTIPCSLPDDYQSAVFSDLCRFDHEHSGNWTALLKLLRIGDELSFRVADNRNGYLEKANIPANAFGNDSHYHTEYKGLHHDTLFATIIRKG